MSENAVAYLWEEITNECQFPASQCTMGTNIIVTNKVQTPNNVQTVVDNVHLVSTNLQGAPCQQQFAIEFLLFAD